MEKQGNLQLELFSQSRGDSQIKGWQEASPFLARVKNYEKTILIIIGMVIMSIFSFSLGVKKGRGLGTSVAIQKRELPKKEYRLPAPEATAPKAPEQKIMEYKQSYTIQLATYKTKTNAQKEAELLKQKGLLPLVLTKGEYIVLCVGNFSDREAARPLVLKLEKRYQGCYIRRL